MIKPYNILLLQAPVPGSHNRITAKASAIPPLGLGYLASVLLSDGFQVKIIDMDIEDINVTELQTILTSFCPSVIGISTTTLTLKNGLRVAKVVKETLPQSTVCLGGPHVSVRPLDAMRHHFVDVVVQGEGEITFLNLCRALVKGQKLPINIKGIVQRSGDRIISQPQQERITSLDILPFPARHLMPLHLYKIPGTILTSRGCPGSCGFCAGPTVLGRKYVSRSAANVVKEVQMCIDLYNLTSFYFVDDTMTHDTKRLLSICEGLRHIKIPSSLNRRLKWTCESRADVITPELLQEMKKSGCTTIQFGMESGSQELLNQLGKKVSLKQIEQAVVWSRQAGISPVLSMVFPHPNETRETLKQTLNFIHHLYDVGAEKIVPALLTLFPGTRFFEEKRQLGLKLLTTDTDEFNLGTPILTTRHLDFKTIVNGYSQLLFLTLNLGGNEIGGVGIS